MSDDPGTMMPAILKGNAQGAKGAAHDIDFQWRLVSQAGLITPQSMVKPRRYEQGITEMSFLGKMDLN